MWCVHEDLGYGDGGNRSCNQEAKRRWLGSGAEGLWRGHEKLLEGTVLGTPPACHPPLPFLFSPLPLPLGVHRSRFLSLDSCHRAGG